MKLLEKKRKKQKMWKSGTVVEINILKENDKKNAGEATTLE